jgi:hypothetical protein
VIFCPRALRRSAPAQGPHRQNGTEKSISWEIEFSRDTTRLALGKATTVCCIWSNKGLKSIPIPAEIRLKLNPPELPAIEKA